MVEDENMSEKKRVLYPHRPIIIYCPDCGDIFKLEPDRGYCPTCKRWYSEDEIRNRCAL